MAVSLGMHLAGGLALLTGERVVERGASPPAIVVDLAPVSVAAPPAAPGTEVAPSPPQEPESPAEPRRASVEADAPPPEAAAAAPATAATAPEAMPAPPVPIQRPAIARPPRRTEPVKPPPRAAKPPTPAPKPKPQAKPSPRPKPELGPRDTIRREAARAAPPAGRLSARPGAARTTASISAAGSGAGRADLGAWHARVRARLQSLQRYPSEAQARGEAGAAVVAFVMDRAGRVLSARLVGSSGSAALDQASLAAVRTASLPAPPPDAPGATFSFTIPLRYRAR